MSHHSRRTTSPPQVGKFAKYYTPAVLLLAGVIGVFQGLEQCLVVVVAGCPCALLGAAPFAHAASLAVLASRHKLLLKRSTAIEALSWMRVIGLDKTGTLRSSSGTKTETRGLRLRFAIS